MVELDSTKSTKIYGPLFMTSDMLESVRMAASYQEEMLRLQNSDVWAFDDLQAVFDTFIFAHRTLNKSKQRPMHIQYRQRQLAKRRRRRK